MSDAGRALFLVGAVAAACVAALPLMWVVPLTGAAEPVVWLFLGWGCAVATFAVLPALEDRLDERHDFDLDADGVLVQHRNGRRRRIPARASCAAEALHEGPIEGPTRICRDRATLIAVPSRFHRGAVGVVALAVAASVALAGQIEGILVGATAFAAVLVGLSVASWMQEAPRIVVQNGRLWVDGREQDPATARIVRGGLRFGVFGTRIRTDRPQRLMELIEASREDRHETLRHVALDGQATGAGTRGSIAISTYRLDVRILLVTVGGALPWAAAFLVGAFMTSNLGLMAGGASAAIVGWLAARTTRRWVARHRRVAAGPGGVSVDGIQAPWEQVRRVCVERSPPGLRVDLDGTSIATDASQGLGWRAWQAAAILARRDGRELAPVERVPADDGEVVVWSRPENEQRLLQLYPPLWGVTGLASVLAWVAALRGSTRLAEAHPMAVEEWAGAGAWIGAAFAVSGLLLLGAIPLGGLFGWLVLESRVTRRLSTAEHLSIQGRFATLALGQSRLRFACEDVLALTPTRRRLDLELADGRRLRIPCDAPEQLARVIAEVGIHPHAVELPAEASRVKRLVHTA